MYIYKVQYLIYMYVYIYTYVYTMCIYVYIDKNTENIYLMT